jgi:hypothetical protein
LSITIIPYTSSYKNEWNHFVANSKNGHFMFNRNYMEYHSDRFLDNSLLFFHEDKLVACFPANIKESELFSHQGLTFGGFITNIKMRQGLMNSIFQAFSAYGKKMGISKILYKALPYIYHTLPSQEDLYSLFKEQGKLIKREVCSVIDLSSYKFSKSKKEGIKIAIKNNVTVLESEEFNEFYSVLSNRLKKNHNVQPTHSLEELNFLKLKFPNEIKLFVSIYEKKIIAGVILFITKQVAHTQYIASSDQGLTLGGVDIIIDYLLKQPNLCKYMSFGVSTEGGGLILNEGLISQKEMFGARSVCHDTYEIIL